LLAAALFAAGCAGPGSTPEQAPLAADAAGATAATGSAASGAREGDLDRPRERITPSLGDPRLDEQVLRVIEAFDSTGRPPAGVAQGGRRGARPGLFENAEGRLPARPPSHYTESDVWPRGKRGRGPQRLVFGRDGEVYYSADHYRTFTRIR
jgi:guanyl-specific ribonuclease Sa